MATSWATPTTTSSGSVNPDKEQLNKDPRWVDYGIRPGKSGYDIQRYLNLDLYPGARDQARFASGLEPGRQSAVLNFLNYLQPGSEFARTERGATGMLNQGWGVGNQAANAATAQGLSPEYAMAVRNAQVARAQRDANSFRAGVGDRMAQGYQQLLQAMREGQEMPMVQSLIPLLFANKQGQQQQQQDDGGGGLLGVLGSVLGSGIGAGWFS